MHCSSLDRFRDSPLSKARYPPWPARHCIGWGRQKPCIVPGKTAHLITLRKPVSQGWRFLTPSTNTHLDSTKIPTRQPKCPQPSWKSTAIQQTHPASLSLARRKQPTSRQEKPHITQQTRLYAAYAGTPRDSPERKRASAQPQASATLAARMSENAYPLWRHSVMRKHSDRTACTPKPTQRISQQSSGISWPAQTKALLLRNRLCERIYTIPQRV